MHIIKMCIHKQERVTNEETKRVSQEEAEKHSKLQAPLAQEHASLVQVGPVLDHAGNVLRGLDAEIDLRMEGKRDLERERKTLAWVCLCACVSCV